MFTFKKKSIKLLMGVALVGLTIAVLCTSVFADTITSVPDGAIELTALRPNTFYYKISGVTDWLAYDESIIESPNNSVYFRAYNRCDNPNEPIVENNYTYYYEYNIRMGVSNDDYDDYDALNFFLSTSQNPNAGSTLSIRGFDDFTITYSYSFPVNHISIAFRTDSTTDYSNYIRFVSEYIGTGNSQYRVYSYNVYRWYDIEGTIYQTLVNQNLNDINDKLDTTNEELSDVNDNLVSIDTNIDSLNDNNTQLLNGVQRKIDAQSAQQHQDAEDIKDELEDLPQRQYEYEHNREQTELNQLLDSFDENSELAPLYDYLDPDNINEAMGNIWTSLSHNNKVYDIIFPSSGNVPLIDATLWDSQVIHLADFTETVPGRLLIAACNGVFALSFIVGIIVFINRAISDTFKT